MTPGDLLGRMTGGRGARPHLARSACSRLFRQGKASAEEVGPEAVADAGFMADVLRDPADDAPRMAYADWLTERDDPRGEFVAVQLELGRSDRWKGPGGEIRYTVCPPGLRTPRYEMLKRRERGLLKAHWFDWTRTFPLIITRHDPRNTIAGGHARGAFRRGFVAHVTLTLADFGDHAAALFGAAPVEAVRLAGREPQDYHNNRSGAEGYLYGWFRTAADPSVNERHALPEWLWDEVTHDPGCEVHGPWADFDARDAAHAALSAACVAHGRRLAGLPALPAKEAARV